MLLKPDFLSSILTIYRAPWDREFQFQFSLVLSLAHKNQAILRAIFVDSPVNICLFKAKNKNNRKKCKICSKLTIKAPEQPLYLSIF